VDEGSHARELGDDVRALGGEAREQGPQFYGCSRQCGRLVRARCSMELGWNPLINGLIQHTFKFNILFLEKFTVIHFD